MSESQKKRARRDKKVQERVISRFLDLEAGEGREDEEEESDSELGDQFLDDLNDEIESNEWPEAEKELALAVESLQAEGSEDAWGSFLSRARHRAQEDSSFRANHGGEVSSNILVQTAHDIIASASSIPDRKIATDHAEILKNLGSWLHRRTQHTYHKRMAAETVLRDCEYTEDFLRDQWKEQVAAQTKPLPRQSKNAGEKAINELIRLRELRDDLKKRERGCDSVLQNTQTPQDIYDDTLVELDKIRDRFQEVTSKIRSKQAALGVNDRHRLEKWISNEYIGTLMKVRALKLRLREKLRARKFELDRVERSFRHQVNNQRVDEHTEASVKRRDPSITQLATKYNKLCDTLADLIKRKKAPPRAVCPRKIEVKGLFALDVDDVIWEDVGLNEDVEPPAWLAVQGVQDGIRGLLERDRCLEEEVRLRHECRSMRIWLAEEWRIVNIAIDGAR
ncbi:hypothetical protein H0H93_001459, partial [Arthromyces matolae]